MQLCGRTVQPSCALLVVCCRHLQHPLSEAVVHELVAEAVELEREFICEALQVLAGLLRCSNH